MTVRDAATIVLGAGGIALLVLAVAGVALLPDAFDRLHLTAPASFGLTLVCAAVVVRESFSLIGDKALVLGALTLVSGPVLSHVTARAAHLAAEAQEQGDR
jgi:multicomponent Na+:H+ antiporter subunit G